LALLPALLTAAALLAALLAALATRRLILLAGFLLAALLLLPALAALLVLLIAWIRHQIYSLGELRLTPHSSETFLTTLMPSCRPRPQRIVEDIGQVPLFILEALPFVEVTIASSR
jgi:hypothetical protein